MNVVKVGHRQVVNMIRQGGNSLMMKVVMVTRNPEIEEVPKKKAPQQQTKRLTPPAITLRSKSMTSELEEMGQSESSQAPDKKRSVYQMALNKLDEILAAAQQTISTSDSQGHKGHGGHGGRKERNKGYYANEQSFDQSGGVGVMLSGSGYGSNYAQFSSSHASQHGMMLRQKSVGVTEEERGHLHPPTMKLSRSLSVPGPDDIPPPPETSAPEPPVPVHRRPELMHNNPTHHTQMQTRAPSTRRVDAEHSRRGGAKMGGLRRGSSSAAPPSDMPAAIAKTTGRRGGKGPLLKQRKVEEGAGRSEKNSIPIPTIIIKAPSTSSSGRSSQNSSVEAEPSPQLEDEEGEHHSTVSIPAPPIALPPIPPTPFPPDVGGTAQRERERFRDSRRKSTSFFYSSEEDVLDEPDSQSAQNEPAPRLRPSKSIDEGLFTSDAASMPPAFGLPQYASQHNTTFIHPLTGKVLDPSSPLSLALAARERALKDDRRSRKEERHFGRQFSTAAAFPITLSSVHNPQHQSSSYMHQTQSGIYLSGSSPTSTSHSPLSRPQSPRMLRLSSSGVMSVEREGRDVQKVHFNTERANQYQTYHHEREGHGKMSQQHRPPLLRMDTEVSANATRYANHTLEITKKSDTEREKEKNKEEDPDGETGGGVMVLPPPAPSVDIADEFVFAEPLPPPLQFANGVDRSVQEATVYNHHQQEHPQQEQQHGGQSLPQLDQQFQNTPLDPPGPTETSQSLPEIHPSTFHPSAIVHPFLFPPSPLLPPPQLCPKIPPANPPQPTQIPQIHPQPPLASPQAADSAASSLTSYDSEVANLTQSALSPSLPSPQTFPLTSTPSAPPTSSDPASLHRPLPLFYPPQDRGSATLTYATMTTAAAATATAAVVTVTMTTPSASRPVVGGERIQSESKGFDWPEAVVDSGIEEPDSHGSSDHHTESVSGERRQQERRVRTESGGIKEGRRVSLDSCLSNTNHQVKMHNDTHTKTHTHKSKPPPPTHAKPHLHNTPKLHTNVEVGRTVPSLRRQTSAAPGFYQPDEKMEGKGGVKAPFFMDRRLNSPLSSVKASIISELSNKLQQLGGWQGQGSQQMQRFSEDMSSLIPAGHAPLLSSSQPLQRSLSPSLGPVPLSPISSKPLSPAITPNPLAPNITPNPLAPTISPGPLAHTMPPNPLTPTPLTSTLSSNPLTTNIVPNTIVPSLSANPVPSSPLTPALTPTLTPQAPPFSTWTPSPSPLSFSHCPLSPPCLPHAPLSPLSLAHPPLSPPSYSHPPISPISLSHAPLSPSSVSYSPYPTSPKHRAKYRTKGLDLFSASESRRSEAHIQRRRAPSPLISCSERPQPGPPRPSSLPLFPSASLYGSPFDLQAPLTPPSSSHPLAEHFFPPTPPLMPPSSPAPTSNPLLGSHSLSPTHFLSGGSSPSSVSYLPPLTLPPPNRPFASKPLPYWTKYDVADWLTYLNLAEHRERFLDNEIDGSHLPSLTKEDFLDLGVSRVGHRMNIERALKRLTERLSSPFSVSTVSSEGPNERLRDEGTQS
ncbi:hypothetical protein PDJAM_G00011900 [Pangasius djambal]|uniref:Uncharacterized protein n=1 Tax=Pangasius djambal TaxID=1691987 RepID=A0ACC5Y0E2_9TELE|nr:hypothetical protein [Pangasius djambal]